MTQDQLLFLMGWAFIIVSAALSIHWVGQFYLDYLQVKSGIELLKDEDDEEDDEDGDLYAARR